MKHIFITVTLACIYFIQSAAAAATCGFDQTYQIAEATWYPSPYSGACNFGPLWGPTGPHTPYITALSASWFDASSQCGICFEITSPYTNKTITVVATDNCPDCPEERHFDLSKDAFAQMADVKLGHIYNLTFRPVACGNIGELGISLVKDSNEYWVGYVIYNSYVGISKVEEQMAGDTTWTEVPRAAYNYFESKRFHKNNAWTVRVTSILGEQITYTVPKAEFSNLLTKQQFKAEGCAVGKVYITASDSSKIHMPLTVYGLLLAVVLVLA